MPTALCIPRQSPIQVLTQKKKKMEVSSPPPRPAPAPYGGTRKIEIGPESKSLNQFGLFARCSRLVLST